MFLFVRNFKLKRLSFKVINMSLMKEKTVYIYSLILDKPTLVRAFRISLIVGLILNIISNPNIVLLDFSNVVFIKVILTFLVPFLVSLYASVITKSKIKAGSTSHLDALVTCKKCTDTEMHIHIGEQIKECPNCEGKTRWYIREVISFDNSKHEMLKSLALFAEHNPQPLFRLDAKGLVVAANKASYNLFSFKDLTNHHIADLFYELKAIDFIQIIKEEAEKTIVVSINNEYFNFMIKGVASIHTIHIYGNNITEVILAQEKVKSLALFAEHNPQPLYRIDPKGLIITSNLASKHLFNELVNMGGDIKDLLPELKAIDFANIIKNDAKEAIVISANNEYFNFMIKGVSSLNTAHIYGNNITEVILAQVKIKEQSIQLSKSIDYAWLIQKAMLPSNSQFDSIFPDNSIFYRPRDVVSGDFYWINQIRNFKFLVVADSTGHGVPGAFMSMVGISLLNEIILREEIFEPDQILNQLRSRIISSLSAPGQESNMSNGMDIALIVIDSDNNTVSYSGAYNPLYLLRNNELLITKADNMPIGKYVKDDTPFTKHTFNLEEKDRIYLFTDGYKDQFGGDRNKKYSPKAFRKLVKDLSQMSFEKQNTKLELEFESWKKDYKQLDDVLVVGIEV